MAEDEVGRGQVGAAVLCALVVGHGPGEEERLQDGRAGDRVGVGVGVQADVPEVEADEGGGAIEGRAGAVGQIGDAAGLLGALAGADECAWCVVDGALRSPRRAVETWWRAAIGSRPLEG